MEINTEKLVVPSLSILFSGATGLHLWVSEFEQVQVLSPFYVKTRANYTQRGETLRDLSPAFRSLWCIWGLDHQIKAHVEKIHKEMYGKNQPKKNKRKKEQIMNWQIMLKTTKNRKIKQIMLKSYMNWQSEVILDNNELIPQEFTRNRI